MTLLEDKESTLNREIGQRIQWRRKQLGLTQEQVAEQVDLTRNFLTSVERGTRGLSLESVRRLSTTLQVSTDFILFGSINNGDRNHILDLIQPLNTDEIFGLEEIIKIYLKSCGYDKWHENE